MPSRLRLGLVSTLKVNAQPAKNRLVLHHTVGVNVVVHFEMLQVGGTQ